MEKDQTIVTSRKSKSEIWKEFYENSTLHGLQNAFASKSLVIRLLWLTFVFAALGYLLFSAVMSVTRFLQYPTTIEITKSMHKSLPFPAVTICSQSFADRKKIFAKDNDSDFREYNLNISACAATESVRAGRPCGHALACAFIELKSLFGGLIDGCTKAYQKNINNALSVSNVSFNLLDFYEAFSESWNEVVSFGFFGKDYQINQTDFSSVLGENMLCHTFNSKVPREHHSQLPGKEGGFGILLKHRVDRYYYPNFAEGYEIFIHEPGMAKSSTGIQVSPGMSTSISIERHQIKNLEDPLGAKCQPNLSLKSYPKYSQVACFDECMSDEVKKVCGCRPSTLGDYDDSLDCYWNDDHHKCAENISAYFDYKPCKCPVGCNVFEYPSYVSAGFLPKTSIPNVVELFGMDYNERDFLYVSVFYESLRDVVFLQKLTFSATSLLGEIGGNMGLLLGCSVLTLIEFVFLFFSLMFSNSKQEVQDLNTSKREAWQN